MGGDERFVISSRSWSDEQHGQHDKGNNHQNQNPSSPSERLYAVDHDKPAYVSGAVRRRTTSTEQWA